LSNALSEKMPLAKPKIAFIEPPERAVFILDRCARSAVWDVALLVATAADSQAVRVANERGIPVRSVPDPELLGECDRVIVGQVPFHVFLSIRQMMRDKPGKVLVVDEFLPELIAREEGVADTMAEERAPEPPPAPAPPRATTPEPIPSLQTPLLQTPPPPPMPATPAVAISEPESQPPAALWLRSFENELIATGTDPATIAEIGALEPEPTPEALPAPVSPTPHVAAPIHPEAAPPPNLPALPAVDPFRLIEPGLEPEPARDSSIMSTDGLLGMEPPSLAIDPARPPRERARIAIAPPRVATPPANAAPPVPAASPEIAPPPAAPKAPPAKPRVPLTPRSKSPLRAPGSPPPSRPEASPSMQPSPAPTAIEHAIEDFSPGEPAPAPAYASARASAALVPAAPTPAIAALPTPASRLMPAPPPLRFDARTFLGAPIHDPSTSIRLDFQDGRIQRLIDEARQLADATAVNLMLLEPDGEHLRVVAASGLGAEVMSILRPHIGVGPPGQAFRDRKPALSRSQAFDLGESDGRPRWRVLASIPITVSQQSIGVVTVKFVSASHLRDEEVVARMDRLAHAMPAALIGAVDLSDLPRKQQREALQLLIDRLMSLDEALPGRLSAFAAALRRVIGGEAIRIYMLDSMEGRLVQIASHEGTAINNSVAADSHFAFLREVMMRGEPLVCRADSPAGAETSTIGFPIQSEHARCLMLLEQVPAPESAPEEVLELLRDMVALLEEMINIEQGMVVQEFISELSMRMADRKQQIDLLPVAERASALLELAIELVAAEVAIWVPESGAPPEVSIPITSEGGRIRAWALAHAPGLAGWIKRKGDRAQGVLAERLDPSAPCGPAPWIGILDPRGRGVLVLFFDPQELAEAPRQVPPHVLWRVLTELCQLMPETPADAGEIRVETLEDSPAEPPAPGPSSPPPPAPRRIGNPRERRSH
jgi:hypothetical protein